MKEDEKPFELNSGLSSCYFRGEDVYLLLEGKNGKKVKVKMDPQDLDSLHRAMVKVKRALAYYLASNMPGFKTYA